ncbi:MAG: MFS transporter, partial [Rhodoferax sp.]|nr:MFS transporter [Rhodoferax sp.]
MVGSFYALGVVFAIKIGLSVSETAMFMSVVVLGGLAFQLPIGVLADRYDRRFVMSGVLMAVGVAWGTLAGFIASGLPLVALLIVGVGFGGAMSSVYPLCVAQTFDRLERKGIGFSNAIGRPKKGPEKAPGRARRGPKYASLGGFSAQSGRLQ